MGHARPTFERRQLGLVLRRLRERTGMTQQASAEVLGKVRSRIVQLEDGSATASMEDLDKLLDCYNVTGDERTTVVELGQQARRRQKRRVHVDNLPDAYRRFADLEASASEINCFETGVIPGLLQSEGYIQALLAEADGVLWSADDSQGEDRSVYRLDRQSRLLGEGDRRIMRFVVTEDALRANMGAPEVMREQLTHLLALIDKMPDLNIRVLQADSYGNPLRGSGLTIFGFGERGTPIGYSSPVFGPSTYYDGEPEATAMLRAFYRSWEAALSREASRRLIQHIAKE
ncbi:helix-turn-helix domain-containing protein [Actinokineospora diospyrosa]|uniref:DNA-binding transcriptional regulator, XRE-family HTH domain n=1 Tax=Actinokineospora diospyrosa TaxID=103728 RepID=A0ABT1IMJ6_9PSEU|nr:helix-turn-helix transcriptional regulator [Actinokineospora diospyrosa]MCP2273708.1 DNA-binding transcriptional regulator, XRE-family HTH domain [Actinokineospora diospyrosa]